jgi:hypothetical protein
MPSEIPQDVIDLIIGELDGDSDALKQCATVASSFLHPSRRRLFSSIHFHNQGQAGRLHELLTSVPGISLYVYELRFWWDSWEEDNNHSAWLRNDRTIAKVLKMLPGLRALTWGWGLSRLDWETDLSNELRSALVDLFQAPNLRVVTITNVERLPWSILSAFTHVKKLNLLYVEFEGPSAFPASPTFALPQLEALVCTLCQTGRDVQLFTPTSSTFPNLSYLSIWSVLGDHDAEFNQRIIQSSGGSIEHLTWTLWGKSIFILLYTSSFYVKSDIVNQVQRST